MAKQLNNIDAWSAIVIFSFFMIDVLLWHRIFFVTRLQPSTLYFFDVAQGESGLLVLPNNIKVMVDGGGDGSIVNKIDDAFSALNDNYIDVAIISYPQLENYEGYAYLLDHYSVGAFVYNGRNDPLDKKEWIAFLAKIQAKNIPLITLKAGDSIHYGGVDINILSPNSDLDKSADIIDTALVEKIQGLPFSVLLASDISKNGEDFLDSNTGAVHADIVKVPFPISSEPDGSYFLNNVEPKVLLVASGVKNIGTAATKSSIATLASSTNGLILPTVQYGTITISLHGNELQVLKEK